MNESDSVTVCKVIPPTINESREDEDAVTGVNVAEVIDEFVSENDPTSNNEEVKMFLFAFRARLRLSMSL